MDFEIEAFCGFIHLRVCGFSLRSAMCFFCVSRLHPGSFFFFFFFSSFSCGFARLGFFGFTLFYFCYGFLYGFVFFCWVFVRSLIQLLEPDVLGVLPEALTAHVQVVLTDQTVLVAAGAAKK